jgi:hypothetical protein
MAGTGRRCHHHRMTAENVDLERRSVGEQIFGTVEIGMPRCPGPMG